MEIDFDTIRNDLEKGDITINEARIKLGYKRLSCFDVVLPIQDTNAIFNTMMAKIRS